MWYTCWLTRIASVHDCGITRPMMWPKITTRMPKWNLGLAIRRSRDSYSCDERVVQPNLSYR
jgi:hypothetical protein